MDGAMQFADPAVEDLTEDLSALVRDWGLREVRPRVRELEASGEFPRELYRDMGQLGFFGCCFPEAMGGTGVGYAALAAVAEQLAWVYPPLSAAMNLQAATVPLTIANWGSDEMVQRYVPGLLAGQLLGCNAMTEPDGGSTSSVPCAPGLAGRGTTSSSTARRCGSPTRMSLTWQSSTPRPIRSSVTAG